MDERTYFISIGSNVAPELNVPACLETLKKRYAVTAVSATYETPPFGPAGDRNFWNLAVSIRSRAGRGKLQQELVEVEAAHGRRRDGGNKFAPGTIDLDLLPKPGYGKLAFVMIPLAEIAPDEKDPETGKTFLELAEKLRADAAGFRKVAGGSAGPSL